MLNITISHKIRRKVRVNYWNLQVFRGFFSQKPQKNSYFKSSTYIFCFEISFLMVSPQSFPLWDNIGQRLLELLELPLYLIYLRWIFNYLIKHTLFFVDYVPKSLQI